MTGVSSFTTIGTRFSAPVIDSTRSCPDMPSSSSSLLPTSLISNLFPQEGQCRKNVLNEDKAGNPDNGPELLKALVTLERREETKGASDVCFTQIRINRVLGGRAAKTFDMAVVNPELAIAAAIVMAGGLIGTGLAQQGIGAAGMGIIAEKPEKFGQVLFFFVIPETLWIIGFVLGIILLLNIL